MPMKDTPLLNIVLTLLLVILVGWLLVIGRPILVPIVTAIISVYLMESASEALGRLPGLRLLPPLFLRLLLLVIFALALLIFAVVLAATVREITAVAPTYEANIEGFLERVATRFGLERQELWAEVRAVSIDQIDLRLMTLAILGGFTNVSTTVFLIVIYAAFLVVERGNFDRKLDAVVRDPKRAAVTRRIISDINQRISDYLAVKTLINVILALISYVFLWLLDIDFALFWAMVIGLLNYIPYFGSYLGVAFPVLLSLAQFGSLTTTLILAALLTAAQFVLGNIVEPRLIGRQLNLSPLVVLAALSVWTAIWGIPGAILAVPLTSILAIVLAGFELTRPFGLLLAERVDDPGSDLAA